MSNSYPSLEQYNDALQLSKLPFKDAALATGNVAKNAYGMPHALCGGFALTYSVTAQNRKYAVRCFHRHSNGLEARYSAIAKKLKSLNSSYFVDFDFIQRGISVGGKDYPIVKMAWAGGETLGEFLEAYYFDRNRIRNLSIALQNLATFLESNNISHGDIQCGNIMVSNDGRALQLLDYDGMFVEELSGNESAELGHISFQHPQRKARHFDEKLDRFSLIILFTALEALQFDPELWVTTQSESESVIFRPNDLAAPNSSPVFSNLARIPALASLAKNFAAICSAPYEKIPTLADFKQGRNIPGNVVSINASSSANRKSYISQYNVVNAADYDWYCNNVGSMVELVGRVQGTEKRYTKTNKKSQFAFINFGDWHHKNVRLVVWPYILRKMSDQIDQLGKGQWISVTGYIHLWKSEGGYLPQPGIELDTKSKIRCISEEEAMYRLGQNQVAVVPAKVGLSNSEMLQQIKASQHKVIPIANTPPAPPRSNSSNQQLLQKAKKMTATQPASVQPATSPVRAAPVVNKTPQSSPSDVGALQNTLPSQRQPALAVQAKVNDEVGWRGWALVSMAVLMGAFFIGCFLSRII